MRAQQGDGRLGWASSSGAQVQQLSTSKQRGGVRCGHGWDKRGSSEGTEGGTAATQSWGRRSAATGIQRRCREGGRVGSRRP